MTVIPDNIEQLPHWQVPRVLVVHGEYPGPNLWRAMWPCGFLSTLGFVADFCSYTRFDEQRGLLVTGRYNIVVTPRIAFAAERLFQQWRDVIRGLRIAWVYDADDDLWSPEFTDRQIQVFEGVPGTKLSRAEYEIQRQQRIYVTQRVDAVTVSTERLAQTAAGIGAPSVAILPNLINTTAFEHGLLGKSRDVPPITIGWSGTRRQDDDLEKVAAAWRIVAERRPEVRFVVQGYQSPALCSAVPSDRLFALRGVSAEQYPTALRNIDVACCSVSDDPWNENKSGIKWMEATLAGSACVVSNALYGPYVEHGQTGFIANSVDDWVMYLELLVDNAEYRRLLQQNARRVVVAQHSLENQWASWVLAWAQILLQRRVTLESNSHGPTTKSAETLTAV